MVQKIITFLVLLASSLPQGFAMCKPGCQMPMHLPSSPAPHPCCSHSNDRVRDYNGPSLRSNATSAKPLSDRDCCRLSNPTPQGLQPQQASRLDLSPFRDPVQFTFTIPIGGPSLQLAAPEAMGGPPQGLETHCSERINPLRI